MTNQIPDYRPTAPVPGETIARYRDRVPAESEELWRSHGFGDGVGGWIEVIDPDVYHATIGAYLPPPSFIPLFAAALAHVVAWDEAEGKSRYFRFRHGPFEAFTNNLSYLVVDLTDSDALAEDWVWDLFPEAAARLGRPAFDSCFAYQPLLALCGAKRADKLEPAHLATHIALFTQLAGPVPYY